MKNVIIAGMICLATSSAFAMGHGAKGHHGHMQHKQSESTFAKQAHDGFTFTNFSVRARIGMAPNSAAYGHIAIAEGKDTLVAASTPVAETVELHEHIHDNGVMRMREVADGLPIEAGKPLEMKPGGLHIMLLGLKGPLDAGTEIDLRLQFASGKTIDLTVPVAMITKMHH